MKQSKVKKSRKCRSCGRKVYGDAAKMLEHEADHKLAQLIEAIGLAVPTLAQIQKVGVK